MLTLPVLMAGSYTLAGLVTAFLLAGRRMADAEKPGDLTLLAYFVAEMALWPVALVVALARGE